MKFLIFSLICVGTIQSQAMSLADVKATQRSADIQVVFEANEDHVTDATPSIYETCNNDYTNDLDNEQYKQRLIEACERLGL